MNIEQIKNTSKEFQADNRQKFKNTQAELKKDGSYKENKCNKEKQRTDGRTDTRKIRLAEIRSMSYRKTSSGGLLFTNEVMLHSSYHLQLF